MLEELKSYVSGLKERLERLRGYLDIDNRQKIISQIEQEMQKSDFWSAGQEANKKIVQLKELKDIIKNWADLNNKIIELDELIDLTGEDDLKICQEIKNELSKIEPPLADLEFKTLFSGRFDKNNAILSINAGAGGTESCDWVEMLLRMYTRWAESKNFKVQILDILAGEEAGIKNVTLSIKGEYVYGYLKSEKGVHRLVRISPFDANKRRHTSFASVDVIPEIQDDIEIQINPQDLRIDTYRSSGAGGQHVNVTDSAVRITHLPTGIIASCQNERSQYQNKAVAMQILRSRLYERLQEEREKQMASEHSKKEKIEWGSQIRSYVLQPYSMIKDHRSDYETGNVNAVLNGGIDKFIESFLKWKAQGKE
ncbi:MAG: peptide chain release factor 2 [Candidatus Omnitrophota bacterium]